VTAVKRVTAWLLRIGVLTLALVQVPLAQPAEAVAGLALNSSVPSGQPVGTRVVWTASVSGPATTVYRFSVAPPGGAFEVMRDFHPRSTFEWTPMDEGSYSIKVTARDGFGSTAAPSEAKVTFTVMSRITKSTPVVTPSRHPLVALYSAPACASGQIRVDFRPTGGQVWQSTPAKQCTPDKSLNFYVAGMRASTAYDLQHVVSSGSTEVRGPIMAFTTGAVATTLPPVNVVDPPDSGTSFVEGVVLQTLTVPREGVIVRSFATDLLGRTVWYYDRQGETPVQPLPGGTMLVHGSDGGVLGQVLREIDLAGNSIRETNVRRVNEQLALLGQDLVTAFHHDAIRLPNGITLALGYNERLMTNVQGVQGQVDILSVNLIAFDSNWQVAWVWNAFNHLDVNRKPTLGAAENECSAAIPFCPPLLFASSAVDWLHANAIDYSPDDGNVLLSLRNQDWVIKIDFRNGAGTGRVLWRLGKDGDFALPSTDPWPWFSHQHDAKYVGRTRLVLFDNGNARCLAQPTNCNSRGQVLILDEANRRAIFQLNKDLGGYSDAWGSAQALRNGNFHFNSGKLGRVNPGYLSLAIETLPDGTSSYILGTQSGVYRSFRMSSLYTP
jgi:arylsulfate sulfotransferase